MHGAAAVASNSAAPTGEALARCRHGLGASHELAAAGPRCPPCVTPAGARGLQAGDLREAGLTAYNHNLDTSPEYYSKITSSRKYEVRPRVALPPAAGRRKRAWSACAACSATPAS